MAQSLDVQVNSSQSFSDTQKAQGRTNIGAASQTDLSLEITNRTNADADLQTQINSKQQTLTAGLNISITNNEIAHAVPSDAVTNYFVPTTGETTFGSNVNVPRIGVDSTGHIITLATYQLTLPKDVCTSQANGLMTPSMLSSLESKLDSITSDNILVTATKSGTGVSLTSVVANPRTTTSNATPSFGGTFSFYHIDGNDNYGRVTVVDDLSVTIPSTVATTTASGLMSSSDKSKLDGISVDGYQGNLTTLYCSTSGTNVISGNTNLRIGVHLASFQGTTYDTSFTQGDTIKMQAIDTTTSEVLGEGVFTVPTTGTNLAVTILCRFYNANSSHYLNFKLIKVSSSSTGTTTFVNALVQEIAWRA